MELGIGVTMGQWELVDSSLKESRIAPNFFIFRPNPAAGAYRGSSGRMSAPQD